MRNDLFQLVSRGVHLGFELLATGFGGSQVGPELVVLRTGLLQQRDKLGQFLIQQRKMSIHAAHYRMPTRQGQLLFY